MQPDSIIPDPANPQSLNRFSYVGNNPKRFTDPSGHCRIDDDPEDCLKPDKSNAPTSPPADPPGDGEGGGGGGDSVGDETDIDEELEFHFRLGNESCDVDCQHTLEGLFVFGTMMDSIAVGLNFGYALTADIAFFINPTIYAGMVIEYQAFSIISNTIGSIGGLTWIASGFVSGENYIEVTANDGVMNVSGSLAQDTIATIILDGAGWISPVAREPNGAVAIGGVGVIYDLVRNPFDSILPTFFQPSFSFTIDINSFLP